MFDDDWVIINTVTTGLSAPINVVELAGQKMKGWETVAPHFQRLLNHELEISEETNRNFYYSKESLERDGMEPKKAFKDFEVYCDGLPIVAYDLSKNFSQNLAAEWTNLGLETHGKGGFCILKLAQRLLDPVPAGNCKLETLRQFYQLPERTPPSGLGQLKSVIDLMQEVLKPLSAKIPLLSIEAFREYTERPWYPSRINFGKFKGREFRDAISDKDFLEWLIWLSKSKNATTAEMGQWYLDQLGDQWTLAEHSLSSDSTLADGGPKGSENDISVYRNPELDELVIKIEYARERLAQLEAEYTREVREVEAVQSAIFILVRKSYEERDRLALIIRYRQEFLDKLVVEGDERAEEVAEEYAKAQSETNSNYEEAAASVESKKDLTDDEISKINAVWKEFVKLYHPDKFSNDPEKYAAFENLTKIINTAKDEGDISLLEEIASDPEGYVARQGWATLDFNDELELESQRKLYESLQVQIVSIIEQLNTLKESPDYELAGLCRKDRSLIESVANERIEVLEEEIKELQSQADDLGAQITEVTGTPPSF